MLNVNVCYLVYFFFGVLSVLFWDSVLFRNVNEREDWEGSQEYPGLMDHLK